MTQFSTLAIVAASALILATPVAFADDNQAAKEADANVNSASVTLYDKAKASETVRGSFTDSKLMAVKDTEGTLYLNHYVETEDLPDPRLKVETVDTYEYEYRGRTYTNKIVETD